MAHRRKKITGHTYSSWRENDEKFMKFDGLFIGSSSSQLIYTSFARKALGS
jgi:hypothetical protein